MSYLGIIIIIIVTRVINYVRGDLRHVTALQNMSEYFQLRPEINVS